VTAPIASSLFLFADQHRASDDDAIFDLKPHNIYFNPRVRAALSGESLLTYLHFRAHAKHSVLHESKSLSGTKYQETAKERGWGGLNGLKLGEGLTPAEAERF
jgi:hypothetical protein